VAAKKAETPDKALDAQLFAMLMSVGATEEAEPAPEKPVAAQKPNPKPKPAGWGPRSK